MGVGQLMVPTAHGGTLLHQSLLNLLSIIWRFCLDIEAKMLLLCPMGLVEFNYKKVSINQIFLFWNTTNIEHTVNQVLWPVTSALSDSNSYQDLIPHLEVICG
jgi:hypothetical protein